jgi:mRNA interferase RelE/StbE
MCEIHCTGAAEKYLKKVKEKGLKKAFQEALEEISCDPYIGELKTGDLAAVQKT